MSARRVDRWYALALALTGAMVVVGLWYGPRGPGGRDRAAPPRGEPAVRTPAPAPRVAPPAPEAAASAASAASAARAPAEPAPPPVPPHIAGVDFAGRYAAELCACADGACLDEVNRRHARRLGRVRATRDAAALHASFQRAVTCAQSIRARTAAAAPT